MTRRRVRDLEKTREYSRRHYENNKAAMKARARTFDRAQRLKIQAFILEYLLDHPCLDCGEADPIVLEFDHRDPATKTFAIGAFHIRRSGMVAVKAEIEKCDVRCANCHRRKTYHERGRKHRG